MRGRSPTRHPEGARRARTWRRWWVSPEGTRVPSGNAPSPSRGTGRPPTKTRARPQKSPLAVAVEVEAVVGGEGLLPRRLLSELHPGANSAGADNPQSSGGELDAGKNSAAEARKRLSDVVVEVLTAISRKKKWEKGTRTKGIAAFAATNMEAMDASFEERDAKLRKELMGALPAGPLQAAKEKEGRTQKQGPKQPQPQPEPESQLLTLVRQELAAFRQEQKKQQEQFQTRMQQQLSLLEGIVLRPPLAASSQRKAVTYAAAAAAAAVAPIAGPSGPGGRGAVARQAPTAAQQRQRQEKAAPPPRGKSAAPKAAGPPTAAAATGPRRVTLPPEQPSAGAEWTVVGA
ncbi:hypothetical protein PYW08_013097 [Mythimna loreyi]|uniref:Uncharacterized protein n=1 Tax=Mythimna loreyi TaxID=667449 RepID=A0ACC2Q1T9_9NEOP|nr:hypothetical protein PYW08_013097 [Mythimna loreyi]